MLWGFKCIGFHFLFYGEIALWFNMLEIEY